jgi:hypothetical protein
MKKAVTLLALFILCFGISSAQKNSGQTVYFKNGTVVTGTLTQDMTNNKITILTKTGDTFVYSLSDVDSIVTAKGKYANYKFHEKGFWSVTEFNITVGVANFNGANKFMLGGSTVLGYKFSPHFTLGGGVAAEAFYTVGVDGYAIPIFLDARYYPMVKRTSIVLGLQAGYSITGTRFGSDPSHGYEGVFYTGGLYVSSLVGVRVYVAKRVAINFGVGYQLRQFVRADNPDVVRWGNYIPIKLGVSF